MTSLPLLLLLQRSQKHCAPPARGTPGCAGRAAGAWTPSAARSQRTVPLQGAVPLWESPPAEAVWVPNSDPNLSQMAQASRPFSAKVRHEGRLENTKPQAQSEGQTPTTTLHHWLSRMGRSRWDCTHFAYVGYMTGRQRQSGHLRPRAKPAI